MRLLIVGAGAAGLAFTSFLTKKDIRSLSVTLIDKNQEAGRKLLATGNGRCNFTNKNLSQDFYYSESRPGFAGPAIKNFTNYDLVDRLSSLGLPATSLESGRVYPATLSSRSLRDLLYLNGRETASFLFSREVLDIDFKKKLVKTEAGDLPYDLLILAPGGESLKNSGSDGKILEILRGKTQITPRTFGITNFETSPKPGKALKGVKVKGRASIFVDGKYVKTSIDDIIFQDYGLTGTAIFNLSNDISLALLHGQGVEINLDLLPDFKGKALRAYLEDLAKRYDQREISDLLVGLFDRKIIPYLLRCSKIRGEAKASNLCEKDLASLVKTIKNLPFKVLQIHDETNAQVTLGGVDCRRINPETMESKDLPGVYLIGEVVDVAGACGGYNLQRAFSSAKACYDDIRRKYVQN